MPDIIRVMWWKLGRMKALTVHASRTNSMIAGKENGSICNPRILTQAHGE